ncbi:SRPBCC family protein [Brevibacterium samyangense]|uniref:SRPBCC family protein n=1 Tax=Brevibacterium samyangense TaxID=366888 RepID=A0ABN2T7P6_9MICO
MITASVVTWENGTDLVLDAAVTADVETVWTVMTDPEAVAEWFAPFTVEESAGEGSGGSDSEDSSGDGPADGGRTLLFRMDENPDEEPLRAELVDIEDHGHVLVEFGALGKVGIGITPTDDPGAGGTRIVVTHTFESLAEAATVIADIGPVWETHLRYLLEMLGVPDTTVEEQELYTRYAQLADEVAAEADTDATEEDR